jgi:transcriptional regulator with XRE-family HTH domain
MSNNPPNLPVLARNVRKLRHHHQLTQQQVADRCQLSRMTILNIEFGKHRPTFETIELLAKALEVPMCKLLEDHDARSTTTRFLADLRSAISRGSPADREAIAAFAMRLTDPREPLSETTVRT